MKLPAWPVLFGCKGRPEPKGQSAVCRMARHAVEEFKAAGHTSHSRHALTLPHIINYCEREGVPYVLTAHPGKGYHIKRGEDI